MLFRSQFAIAYLGVGLRGRKLMFCWRRFARIELFSLLARYVGVRLAAC
jgi:hypothetical protein